MITFSLIAIITIAGVALNIAASDETRKSAELLKEIEAWQNARRNR